MCPPQRAGGELGVCGFVVLRAPRLYATGCCNFSFKFALDLFSHAFKWIHWPVVESALPRWKVGVLERLKIAESLPHGNAL